MIEIIVYQIWGIIRVYNEEGEGKINTGERAFNKYLTGKTLMSFSKYMIMPTLLQRFSNTYMFYVMRLGVKIYNIKL